MDDTKSLNVMETGDVDLPYYGRVKAFGKTCYQLATEIKPLLEKNLYNRATVIVSKDQMRKVRGKVYLSGALNQIGPMDIPIDETFTLSKAVLKSGGFAPGADRNNARIERKTGDKPEDKKTLTVDLYKVMEEGKSELDTELEPGDFVIVPMMASLGRVYVVGAVNRPGPISITAGEKLTVSKAVLAAGGFAEFGNKGKVKVVRKTGEGLKDYKEFFVDVGAVLEKGQLDKDVEIQGGDQVIVSEKLINF
jgi:protein involved in polysaccharide export with SLBB domain